MIIRTHNLYTRNIKYTMKRHRQSNKKNTHIQYSLWTVLAISTTRHRWQNRRVWRKSSAVQAPDNIISNISSCTRCSQSWKSSTHDRTSVPDSYHHTLTQVNFWLLTVLHTCISNSDSNYSNNETIPCTQPHVLTSSRDAPASANE